MLLLFQFDQGDTRTHEFDLDSVDVGKQPERKDYLNIFGRGCVSLASMPLVTSLASTVMSALISCSTRLDVSVTFTGLPSLKGELNSG